MGVAHVQELLDAEGYNEFDLAESGFEKLDSVQLYHARWTIHMLDVWADEEGHVFGISHEVPATEYQEGQDQNATVVPVQPVASWSL